MLVWRDEKPLETGRPYQLRIGTSVSGATISGLRYAVDVTTRKRVPAGSLGPNEIGRASLTLTRAVPHDLCGRNRSMGALVLEDPADNRMLAAGMVLATRPTAKEARPVGPRRSSLVTPAERRRLLGQRPLTVWLTGLAGSEKSSIAFGLEKRLVDAGHPASVLDSLGPFPGVTSPYEARESPELSLPTYEIGIDEAIDRVVRILEERGDLSTAP